MQHGRYRLRDHDYRLSRWYFVTVVTAHRRHAFGTIEGCDLLPNDLGRIVREETDRLPERRPHVRLAASAILPNHVHLLLGWLPNDSPEMTEVRRFEAPAAHSLGSIVGGWKAGVCRRARQEGLLGAEELWQRRFHDRLVRSDDEWNAIADYILWNPVNWHVDPLNGSRAPTNDEIRDWKSRNDLERSVSARVAAWLATLGNPSVRRRASR